MVSAMPGILYLPSNNKERQGYSWPSPLQDYVPQSALTSDPITPCMNTLINYKFEQNLVLTFEEIPLFQNFSTDAKTKLIHY